MSITSLIFDLGKVVLTGDTPYHTTEELKQFSSHYKVPLEKMKHVSHTAWDKFKLGKITEDEYWEERARLVGAKNPDIIYAKNFWRDHQKPSVYMLELLSKLKVNYRLISLTTISKEWLSYKRKRFNLDKYFETIVSSAEYGVAKPDRQIYEIFLRKTFIDPFQCVFIDDLGKNLIPAKNLGMQTILFTGLKSLEKRFDELKIIYT